MGDEVQTWHHGLVARWWAEFNQGGDDVDFFRHAVSGSGAPVLDAGCGTGRLLLPLRRDGFDVDGADVSTDMLDRCRSALAAEGLSATLYPQALHELNLPRDYRTIVVCGAFGLGGSREQDLEGLRRLHAHLQPGGTLFMDHYLPNLETPEAWKFWLERPELPGRWPRHADRRRAADGTELEMRARLAGLDPLALTSTLEIEVRHLASDRVEACETGLIRINLYFRPEIELMLRVAGFTSVSVTGGLEDRPARPWEDARIVFRARRP